MNADRHIQAACFFVNREEILIARGAIATLDAFLEYAARAMILRPTQLLHRPVY